MHQHAAGALYEWLENKSRKLIFFFFNKRLQGSNIFFSWCVDEYYFKQFVVERIRENTSAAHAHCSKCVAMIGVFKCKQFSLFMRVAVPPVLQSHLHRHFNSCRTIVGIKDF